MDRLTEQRKNSVGHSGKAWQRRTKGGHTVNRIRHSPIRRDVTVSGIQKRQETRFW
jgi:hypothetical protein